MQKNSQEHRLQLVAGRHGLKLVRNRHRVAAYCLRAIGNAACVVARRSDGRLGLVFAQTGREGTATWLTLHEIERVLANWNEPAPRAWGEPPSARSGLPYANYWSRRRRVDLKSRHLRTRRHRLTSSASRTGLSASSAQCQPLAAPLG